MSEKPDFHDKMVVAAGNNRGCHFSIAALVADADVGFGGC